MVATSTTPPRPPSRLQEIHDRNAVARRLIRDLRNALPPLASLWEAIAHALADLNALLAEIRRGHHAIAKGRLDLANLRAAARATLAAHDEGEPDPLSYLRDELAAQTSLEHSTSDTTARDRYRYPYRGEAR